MKGFFIMKLKKIVVSLSLSMAAAITSSLGCLPASALEICDTDVTTSSDGNVMIGIEGTYIECEKKAVDLINSYRLEACQKGYINPSSGEKLTMSDYVPIKWSDDLEYIARIRAAESSVTMAHVRTNNNDCFEISSPSGKRSWGEVLAWNWSDDVTSGINQWYEEKEAYLNKTPNAVTGHYTQMIDPENTYVGIGTFLCDSVSYHNTTCGEFSSETSGQQYNFYYGECVQKIETIEESVEFSLNNSNDKLIYGTTKELSLGMKFCGADGFPLLDTVSWTSSNPDIISVSEDKVTASNYGTATLSAKIGGITKSFNVTVIDKVLGDANGDGSVDSKDAVLVLKSYAEELVSGKQSVDVNVSDVNKDSKVDSKDAVEILKTYAKNLVGNKN